MSMKIHSEQGASAVEFALVLPMLMLLTFGIIEFGVLLFDKAVITNASREGARFGIVFVADLDGDGIPDRKDETTIESVITGYANNLLINLGSEVEMLVARAGNERLAIQVTPRLNPPAGEGPTGIQMGMASIYTATESYPLWEAVAV